MYLSTKDVLNFIIDLIDKNTIIIFDDWGITDFDSGEKLAFKEWLKENTNIKYNNFYSINNIKSVIIK